MASLQYSGNAEFQTGTLGSSYTSGGSSMSLTSGHGARFPSSGDFWIRVDDEILKVTARSTDTLTVTGAQDGTSAANHSSGSTVRWVLSAGALTQLRADLVQTGTYASIPSASSVPAGTLYLPTDSLYEAARSNGTDWQVYKGGYAVTVPPSSSWTTVNAGSETFSNTYGPALLAIPPQSSENIRARVRSVTAPYTVTMLVSIEAASSNFTSAGLIGRNSSDGKIIIFGLMANSGTQIYNYYHPSATTGGSTRGTAYPLVPPQLLWLRISDDNTNRVLSWSRDGNNWITYSSSARTTDLTVDQVGFGGNATNSTQMNIHLLSWIVS